MSDKLWKLRWWWRWFWAENDAPLRERRRRFANLTGLHACYVQNRLVPDDEVIALQARKIRGLETQLDQQRRGYLRKIARLQRALVQAERSEAAPDRQVGPGTTSPHSIEG
jgi:hypothetical protein